MTRHQAGNDAAAAAIVSIVKRLKRRDGTPAELADELLTRFVEFYEERTGDRVGDHPDIERLRAVMIRNQARVPQLYLNLYLNRAIVLDDSPRGFRPADPALEGASLMEITAAACGLKPRQWGARIKCLAAHRDHHVGELLADGWPRGVCWDAA